jgi:hypothetical protein
VVEYIHRRAQRKKTFLLPVVGNKAEIVIQAVRLLWSEEDQLAMGKVPTQKMLPSFDDTL